MPVATKTAVEVFIATAAGFWRAIGELDNVARRTGEDLQREAWRQVAVLQRKLDGALRDWNDDEEPDHQRVAECLGANTSVPWETKDCAIYRVAADPFCPSCSKERNAYMEECARG